MSTLLYESCESIKNKIKEIEERHIRALRKSNLEIEEMLQRLPANKLDKTFSAEEEASDCFPVDHRIVK